MPRAKKTPHAPTERLDERLTRLKLTGIRKSARFRPMIVWRGVKDASLHQATAMPSISIFQAELARPPTISVLAGLRSPSTLLCPSRGDQRLKLLGQRRHDRLGAQAK
jgi:hypothetical protein